MKGYEVMQAENGQQAFEMALQQPPDLIISDLGMPIWDGHRLLQEIQRNPRLALIPFVILTAWADRGNMRKGLQDGAVDYITKPFTLTEIDQAVASHLGRKRRQELSARSHAISDLIPSILHDLPHELRTPMNGILAPSEMLLEMDSDVDVEEVAQLGEIIHFSALRLLRIVDNISLFLALQAKTASGENEWICSSSPGISPMRLLEQISKEVIKRQAFPERLLRVRGEMPGNCLIAEEMGKVFEEILENACQFAPSGTGVDLEWGDSGEEGSLTIVNQGPGMTAEQIEVIRSFGQLNRSKNEPYGLGLGLFIATQLANQHGGSITIESSPEGPTAVTVGFRLKAGEPNDRGMSVDSFVGRLSSLS